MSTHYRILFIACLVCGLILIYTVNLNASGKKEDIQELGRTGRGLALLECVKFALENSFEVKLAQLDYLITEADIPAARAIYDTILSAGAYYTKDELASISSFAPSLSRNNSYSVGAQKTLPLGTELSFSLEDSRDWSNSSYVSSNPAHTAEAGIQARQPIGKNSFGYIDRRSITLTQLAVNNASLQTKERIEALLAQVEQAYWQWVFCKRSLEIYQQILEQAHQLHQSNANNFDLGRIEKADLLASEANVLIREKDLALAENNYRQAEEKIKLLINLQAQERIYPVQDLEYLKPDQDLETCLNQAFSKRRDYQQAKTEIERQELVLETKQNARWPEIDLVASLVANGISSAFYRSVNNIVTDDNTKVYAGIEFSIPLENSAARSDFTKAQHNKEKALLGLKNIERSIVTEVGCAYRDYITYAANFTRFAQAAQLQQQKLQEEQKRFQSGRSSTKILIDYQQDYLRSELEAAGGIVDLEVARINLEKEINAILEKYARLL